jgi:hypothetical protein
MSQIKSKALDTPSEVHSEASLDLEGRGKTSYRAKARKRLSAIGVPAEDIDGLLEITHERPIGTSP